MKLEQIQKIMEYLHATLLLALPVSVMYAVGGLQEPAGAAVLYLKCLLIVVPVIVTDQAVRHIKNLVFYLAVCTALAAVVWCCAGMLSYGWQQKRIFEVRGLCYSTGLLAETIWMAVLRLKARIREAAIQREEGLFGVHVWCLLDIPSRSFVWYFVGIYVIGIGFDSKMLCDMAFISAIIYFFLALAYTFLEETKEYFVLNKRTKGIPKRRLFGISGGMALVFCLFLAVCILPAILLAGQRRYTDIRKWFDDVELIPYEYENEMAFQEVAKGGADLMELLAAGEPAPEFPVIQILLKIIGVISCAFFVYGVIRGIVQIFRDFRNGRDDNGDKIEELADRAYEKGLETIKKAHWGGSEAERIRRKYKRTIRRHRKDRPAPFEAPFEIETNAGIAADADMIVLHREYEAARYARQPDTM